jgi:hypothetical protein
MTNLATRSNVNPFVTNVAAPPRKHSSIPVISEIRLPKLQKNIK